MRRPYDVFEKFPDGSTLWRACVNGRYEAQRKMHELAEHSGNEFFLIDIRAEVILPLISTRRNSRPLIESAAGG
jgi:hypothetical protein